MSHYRSYPPLTLCTSSALPRRAGTYAELANEIGADGIDLDLSTWVGWRVPGLSLASQREQRLPIRSAWVPASALDCDGATIDRLRAELDRNLTDPVSLAVILPARVAQEADVSAVARASGTAATLASISDVVMVIPAAAPEGGRAHLNRLHILRRIAEEWSVGIGFDLGPHTDSGWEAEAAVQIVGSRLRVVRVRSRLADRTSRSVEVHQRALRAAADRGFRGPVSLVPPTPWWMSWHAPTVRADLGANRDVVAYLYAERHVATDLPNPLRLL